MGDTEYLAGDTFSVADITGVSAFLMIRQIKVDVPETLTNLHAWLDRVKSRDSVQEFIRKK
jgi:glutathione S-transferase